MHAASITVVSCASPIALAAEIGDRRSANFGRTLTFRAESAVTWLARANGDDCLRDLCTAAQLHLAGPPGTLTSEPTSSGVELGGPIAPKSCALATRGTLKNVESMARTRERRWPAPRFWRGTLKYIPAGHLPKNLGEYHPWGRARQPRHQNVSPGPRFDTVAAAAGLAGRDDRPLSTVNHAGLYHNVHMSRLSKITSGYLIANRRQRHVRLV